ncbi:MAG: radical SAM protein [Elusimicrobiota bacterium]
MRVGFVNTSSRQNCKPFRIDPLGSLYLLTILEQEFGDRLELSFTDLRGVREDALIYHIPEKDVYLHYVTTPEFSEIERIVADLRKVYPRAMHLAGGPHINIFPQESLRVFDAIGVGEGEEIIKAMIRDILSSTLKKVYEAKGHVDLNAYPFPLRKYLPKTAITDIGLLSKKEYQLPGTSVLFSRGCPFSCHFCSNQYRGPTRFRSPERIIEEIEYLKREYGIQALLLKDDQGIPVQKEIARAAIEAIAKTGVKWRAQSRANGVHTEIVRLAKAAGCTEVAVAVESVSQKSLDIMNKKIDLQKAKDYLQTLKREGLDVKLLLILGLPGEPRDIAQKTIEFIEETGPTCVSLSILCPIPGSEIYRNPSRFGMRINPEVSFDKYLFAFGRFDGDEHAPRFFEYEKETPFGEGMSMDEILANHAAVQGYLRDHAINF